MKLKDIMTREVEVIHPNDSIQMAAERMRDKDIGFLPVYDGDQLIGVLTDRDITTRVVANGTHPEVMLGRDIVTSPAIQCFDDQDVSEAAHLMHHNQIRRLVILRRSDNRLVGILSLGDLIGSVDEKMTGEIMQSVSAPVKTV